MANINKIRLSGQTYNIQDPNASKTVELTQVQYDALTVKDPNTFYIITDAQGADLSNYYTKSETSGATQISTALASKQTTLTAGTGISIVDNVISATGGGGGGKAVSGGTNISITTGETADTINCTLPISANNSSIIIKDGSNNISDNHFSQVFGSGNTIAAYGGYNQDCITVEGINNSCGTQATHVEGGYNRSIYGSYSHVEGAHNELSISISPYTEVCSHVEGKYNKVLNYSEHASGQYNNSVSASTTFGDSGNTLFSVGNGTADNARHNAFEIRQNGDIYITKNGQDVKLQDQLGGGGGASSYTAGDGIDITNDVISVTGKVDTTAITTSISSSSTDAQVPSAKAVYDQLGGLSIVKLTESEYAALVTKDSNTLYCVVPDPSN